MFRPFFNASSKNARFSAKLPWTIKHKQVVRSNFAALLTTNMSIKPERKYLQTLCRRQRFPGGAAALFLLALFCRQSAGDLNKNTRNEKFKKNMKEDVLKLCINRMRFGGESVPLRWTCSRFFCASFSSNRSLNTHFSSCTHKNTQHSNLWGF